MMSVLRNVYLLCYMYLYMYYAMYIFTVYFILSIAYGKIAWEKKTAVYLLTLEKKTAVYLLTLAYVAVAYRFLHFCAEDPNGHAHKQCISWSLCRLRTYQ